MKDGIAGAIRAISASIFFPRIFFFFLNQFMKLFHTVTYIFTLSRLCSVDIYNKQHAARREAIKL